MPDQVNALFGGAVAEEYRGRKRLLQDVEVTILGVSLGTIQAAGPGGLLRPGQTQLVANQRLSNGNPDQAGRMCSATTNELGLFCIPFSMPNSATVIAASQDRAEIRYRAALTTNSRVLRFTTRSVNGFIYVPGGTAVSSYMQSAMQPLQTAGEMISDRATGQVTERIARFVPGAREFLELKDLVEYSAQIGRFLTGATVPGNRVLLIRLALIVLPAQ